MMDGGIEHAATARAIELSYDIQLQLERTAKAGFRPLLFILADARQRAIAALTQLAIVDASDAKAIRILQNEVVRFDDMVATCRKALAQAHEAGARIDEQERAAINNLIMNDWATADAVGAKEADDR